MDRVEAGRRIIKDMKTILERDSFLTTNFKVEHSGEWKSGCMEEYHERLVLYPEDNWMDTCGNGFSIEYFYIGDAEPKIAFGVRNPETAPRNMEFSEELASMMEKSFKNHGYSYETLKSSEEMDSHWRVWTMLSSPDAALGGIGEILRIISEVFIEREKLVRPDYLLF